VVQESEVSELKTLILQCLAVMRSRTFGGAALRQVNEYYEHHFANAQVVTDVLPDIGINLLKLGDFPHGSLDTYVTRGMSRYAVRSPMDGAACRCELGMTVMNDSNVRAEMVLEEVAKICVATLTAPTVGSTFEYPFAERFRDPTLSVAGLFSWSGIWIDSCPIKLGSLRGVEIELYELIPITAGELHRVKFHLDEFIDETVGGRVDLLDFRR